jgi:pSer/pThr/pTyr-binding forkhead associated (FHA) protein
MMSAFAIDKDTVDESEVRTAIEELQWIEYAGRTNRMRQTDMVVPVLRNMHADAVLGRLLVAADGRTIGDQPLKIGRLLVGRTPENDLQIDSQYVSRHHCQVTVALEGVVIEDLNSTNGIVCRGRRVRRQLLNDGDVVVIGRHTLTYVDERPGALRPATDPAGSDASPTGSQETLAGAAETGNGPH